MKNEQAKEEKIMTDRETMQEKLEYEIFSEQCFEQAKEEETVEDKSIMIDNIDVSKCEQITYKYSLNPMCGDTGICCRGRKNCDFKQLARKEQELENICKAFDIEYIIDKETGNLIGRCNKLCKKEQECEELREYHNKCCQEFEKEKQDLINRYNQLSRDFYSGKYCDVEKCKQLDQLKASKEQAEQKLEKIREFATALCYTVMSDGVVILQKDILQIIDEVE